MSAGVARAVEAALDRPVERVTPVGGGSISDAVRVDLADGERVFAKSVGRLPAALLEVEAEGLAWLREVPGVRVPSIVASTSEVLVLEWVEPGRPGTGTDADLGHQLARLHATPAGRFGWHRDGFIGREVQRNTPGADDWCTFWVTHRIDPLVERAVSQGALAGRAPALVERLRARLPALVGEDPPAVRVHGDLWSGNVHVDGRGRPWLIDPAAYGGHREVDLAMLHLFGAPGARGRASSYAATTPAPGWRDRLALWQLEPLLAHAVMFGGGYGASALSVLDRYAGS